MNTPKLILIAVAALLAWQLLATPVQTAATAGGGGCSNPGTEQWAQMSVLERAAYGWCAAGEATK